MEKRKLQLIYGVVLILVGFGVFHRIPEAMVKISTIDFFSNAALFVKILFYLLGVLVIIAGIIKIKNNYK